MEEKYFPIYISLKGKHCLVYGGGEVAARRTGALLRFGAKVQVIAPKICGTIWQYLISYPDQITVAKKGYEPGDLEAEKGYKPGDLEAEKKHGSGNQEIDFVLACTDDREAQEAIFQECRRLGIPVNLASDQKKCDFFFPALVEQDGLVIGVCSGGRNHGRVREAARRLRQWLADQSFVK